MVKLSSIIKFLCLFSIIILLMQAKVLACTCIGRSIQEHKEAADVVFLGKVVEIKPAEADSRYDYAYSNFANITFEISDMWKGNPVYEITLFSDISSVGGRCNGYPFEMEQEFLVFAYYKDNRLRTGICEGTIPAKAITGEMKELGASILP